MSVKLLTDHHLESLRLKEGCTGSSESTHVKMPHCWKSHVTAHFIRFFVLFLNQNICCGYSKEPPRRDGSFEHQKRMFKLMDKKIIAILR